MSDEPSFAFTTPEAARERSRLDSDDEDWHFRNGPSPIAPRFEGEELEETKTDELAQSHFRRRNRLESRLEELQKDVASLTFKLRNNSINRSVTNTSASFLLDKSADKVTSKKVNHSTAKSQTSQSVRTLRELHKVTTERDQLKFELDKTKKALLTAEKKSQEVAKLRKAYEKLKAHCDSLQQSLDLSERIRVRQKKLMQQMQLQQRQEATTKTTPRMRKPSAKNIGRSAKQPVESYSHTSYDILDSLVSHDEDAGLETHEQSPSEPTAATSRSRTPRSGTKATASRFRSDFDSLLRVNETPQFSTRQPSRSVATTVKRPTQGQTQQREAMRQATKWAQRRNAPIDASASTIRVVKRSPTNRPKNSFLAPTQASLRRLHELPLRDDHNRRPFVV